MPLQGSFQGVYPILATPFDDRENVDLESFGRIVRFMADIGVDGVTILGVLGESGRMVDIEREQLIKTAVAAAGGRIPVVVQDHPASTEVHMSVELMLRIVREIPGVACIKEEAPPTPARITALIRGMTSRRVPILTGLGALYGLFDLECGSAPAS